MEEASSSSSSSSKARRRRLLFWCWLPERERERENGSLRVCLIENGRARRKRESNAGKRHTHTHTQLSSYSLSLSLGRWIKWNAGSSRVGFSTLPFWGSTPLYPPTSPPFLVMYCSVCSSMPGLNANDVSERFRTAFVFANHHFPRVLPTCLGQLQKITRVSSTNQ